MSLSKIFVILSVIFFNSCIAEREESSLEAVAPPNVKALMSCDTEGGWELTLATSGKDMFLVYKKNMSFGFEMVEGKKKEVLSPVSKYIHVGLLESSRIAGKSISLKAKLASKKESDKELNSDEPSEVEFARLEAFISTQASLEVDYKEPSSTGKLGFQGDSSQIFESPFLVCNGAAKFDKN